MRTRRPAVALLAALSCVFAAGALGLVQAGAATPSEVTVGVGGAGSATASYAGASVIGNADPIGPPAPQCTPQQCDRETVHLNAPAGWTNAHVLTLKVTLVFDPGPLGNTVDIAILDKTGNPLATSSGVSTGGVVGVKDVQPGDYVVEVDGDIALTPQTYTGKVQALSVDRVAQLSHPLGKVTFSRETVADPFRLGTEPNIAVEPDGKTVYESPIFGFSTTQSFLQRSQDGGQTFKTLSLLPGVGKLDQCTGGGDSDLSTDQYTGDVYMIDLGGAPEVPARVSHDHGQTFASSCEANFHDGANYFTDRQWLSTDLVHKKEFFIYRDGLLTLPGGASVGGVDVSHQGYGEYIKTAPLASAAGTAGANQLAFTNLCQTAGGIATPCVVDVTIAGNAVTDNAIGKSRYAGQTYLAFAGAKGVGVVVVNPDNKAAPITERFIPGKHSQILFPTIAVDRAGRIYEAWVDNTTAQVQFASSPDQGKTWSGVQTVNAAPAATTVMPWIVAGDSGRVDVVFLGTQNSAPPTTNYGPWYGYLAQTLDGDSASPHFTQVRFSDRPTHIDPVCLSGLGCTTNTGPGGDRNLGDFFKITADKSGRALISFADGDNQLGTEVANGPVAAPSFAHFVRQASGPSLYAAVGNVPAIPVPTNSVTVGTHTAPIPLSVPGTGAYGDDAAALNLTSAKTTILADGSVKTTVKVKALGTALPPAGGAQIATYLTRWIYKDHVYFTAAEIDGVTNRFFGGQARPVSDALAIKYANYPAGNTIAGTAVGDNNTITMTLPAAMAGNPTPASTLYSVTTFALARTTPTAPTPPAASNLFDFPQVADVLPAYNVAPVAALRRGGHVTVPPLVVPARPSSGGSLAATGLPFGNGVAALLLLAGALGLGAWSFRLRTPAS